VARFPSLQVLYMARCGLRGTSDVLSQSATLRELHMSGNKITSVDFEHLPRGLRLLNLASNPLQEMPSDPRTALPQLSTLVLTECGLTASEWLSDAGTLQVFI
jgi:Leucine-rich repeat (LRR) protein